MGNPTHARHSTWKCLLFDHLAGVGQLQTSFHNKQQNGRGGVFSFSSDQPVSGRPCSRHILPSLQVAISVMVCGLIRVTFALFFQVVHQPKVPFHTSKHLHSSTSHSALFIPVSTPSTISMEHYGQNIRKWKSPED